MPHMAIPCFGAVYGRTLPYVVPANLNLISGFRIVLVVNFFILFFWSAHNLFLGILTLPIL
jgi:hypothetical protein